MELNTLFTMQETLDTYIQEQHQLTHEDLFEEKLLALLVELSELANETRCFKFWSTKGPSARPIVLEEYVDSIHFLLSLGIVKNLSTFNEWEFSSTTDSLTTVFIQTNQAVVAFGKDSSMSNYVHLWNQYGTIAEKLGFTSQDIIDAYIKKNDENYKRQNSGY